MIDELMATVLAAQYDRAQVARVASLARSVAQLGDAEVDLLLDHLIDLDTLGQPDRDEIEQPIEQLLQPIVDQLVQREQQQRSEETSVENPWSAERIDRIERLYLATPESSDLRNHLLRWLAVGASAEGLRCWLRLMVEHPPTHRLGVVLAFSPLMQPGFVPPDWLLEGLLNGATAHSQIAPAVYDLFNFYYRERRVASHPAEDRLDQLTQLLGQLAGQLGRIEDGNLPPGANAAQINLLVSDSVSLIVALCDTFAQLEYQEATGKLHQALSLRHRRVQTEAAAALARLGDELGKQTLIELAEQPVSRLRVLSYADELGFRHEISLELQGELAVAESHLAIWLSEPAQMGLAPSAIEFLESRELYWPGYEHPVQCYLFQYTYGAGEQSHSNLAICGPMTHAFAADLRPLSRDDVFAAFAGWQTVHAEIYQVPVQRAQSAFPNDWRRLLGDLNAEGLESVQPVMAGSFFGQLVVIASAQREGHPGHAVADGSQVTWYPVGNPAAPVDHQLAYAIWRGHQLLNSFNEAE